jgi:hypothetical protein
MEVWQGCKAVGRAIGWEADDVEEKREREKSAYAITSNDKSCSYG